MRGENSYEYPGSGLNITDLDVLPRRWVWQRSNSKHWKLAVLMPIPEYTGSEPCVGHEDVYLTDDPQPRDTERFIAMTCYSCPLVKACGAWALAHERHYWWGGMSAEQREARRKEMGLQVIEPSYLHHHGLNSDPMQSLASGTCPKGHPLHGSYDLVAQPAKRQANPYNVLWRVSCHHCFQLQNTAGGKRAAS